MKSKWVKNNLKVKENPFVIKDLKEVSRIENEIINWFAKLEDIQKLIKHKENKRYDGFFNFCEKNNIYEVFTLEFVNKLYDEIIEENKKNWNWIILEVWAWNWKLTKKLKELSLEKWDDIKFIATDSFERYDLKFISDHDDIKNHVEKLSHKEAIKKHNPWIIITSWIPSWDDFTKDFRNKDNNCKTYYVIWQEDWWCCWNEDTFNKKFLENDGFDIKKLEDISKLQIGRAHNYNFPILNYWEYDDEEDWYESNKKHYLENVEKMYYSNTFKCNFFNSDFWAEWFLAKNTKKKKRNLLI